MFKDVMRFALAQFFESAGFDHEMLLFRFQTMIAIIGSPPYSF